MGKLGTSILSFIYDAFQPVVDICPYYNILFACNICDKSGYKKGLAEHQKSEHVKCRWCEYKTHSKIEDIHKHYWSDHKEKVVQEEIDAVNLADGFEKKSRESHSCGHCRDKFSKTVCTNIRERVCCSWYWIHKVNKWYREGQEILICSSCYKHILTCKKVMSVTGNTLYNISEGPGNLYRVAFYINIISICADPKPCRLCRNPVGELIDPNWSTNPSFLELKHRYLLCPVLGEPRQRILSKLSSLLMEETTEPDPNNIFYVST